VILRWLRRKKPRQIGPHEWAAMHGWPDQNPLHQYLYPDCREPLPHGHHLFTFTRDKETK